MTTALSSSNQQIKILFKSIEGLETEAFIGRFVFEAARRSLPATATAEQQYNDPIPV